MKTIKLNREQTHAIMDMIDECSNLKYITNGELHLFGRTYSKPDLDNLMAELQKTPETPLLKELIKHIEDHGLFPTLEEYKDKATGPIMAEVDSLDNEDEILIIKDFLQQIFDSRSIIEGVDLLHTMFNRTTKIII